MEMGISVVGNHLTLDPHMVESGKKYALACELISPDPTLMSLYAQTEYHTEAPSDNIAFTISPT